MIVSGSRIPDQMGGKFNWSPLRIARTGLAARHHALRGVGILRGGEFLARCDHGENVKSPKPAEPEPNRSAAAGEKLFYHEQGEPPLVYPPDWNKGARPLVNPPNSAPKLSTVDS